MIKSTTPVPESTLNLLWSRVIEQTQYALSCGSLQPIPTEYEFIEQDGVCFLVRIISNLARKEVAKKQKQKITTDGKSFNPFLPYEKNLFVADISPSHLCLLNKFNVVEHHLLIITREFEEQDNWLTLADFEALWLCLEQIDGLGFYNGGQIAGSSQPHKHLQLVPFPFTPKDSKLPIETAISSANLDRNLIGTLPVFSFIHAFAKFNSSLIDPAKAAKVSFNLYHQLLQKLNLWKENDQNKKQTGAYNLLITKEWMLVVPRTQESFQSIAVNSLGFAGALLVRNAEQMQLLKQYSPMTILKNVAISI